MARSADNVLREPPLLKTLPHTYAQPPRGLRTGHVNLITWPRAVWDTWGYRIRPTAWRGARSTRELKGQCSATPLPLSPRTPSAPPISVVVSGNRGSLQRVPLVNEVAQSKGGDLLWINLIRVECLSLHSLLGVASRLERLEEVEGFRHSSLKRTPKLRCVTLVLAGVR